MAEDGTKVAPNVYRAIFEDEHARVVEVTLRPGETTALHSHPGYVVYLTQGGKVQFTTASGETAEVELPAGAAMWRDAEDHSTTNIGGTELRAIFFEPK